MKAIHFTSLSSMLLILGSIGILSPVCLAQGEKGFAMKGATELGGSISFESQTMIYRGNSGGTASYFSFTPYAGYFITDGFELGFDPLGISTFSYSGGTTVTQLMIFAAPSYNFRTESIAYPFVEALLGYTSNSSGGTQSGFSWGGRAGVKLAVTGNGLLNLALQYTEITENPSGSSGRTGWNEFLISAGFSIWLR